MKKQIFWLVLVLQLSVVSAYAGEGGRNAELIVSRSDTLIGLCNRYLEHPDKWRQIARLNRLADPDRLSPGQKIVIPVEMLKTLPRNGSVTFSRGSTFTRGSKDAEWIPVRLHDVVRAGASLKTGVDSSLEVTFDDGTLFVMREQSELTVKEASGSLIHLLRVIYLKSGKIISRVKAATGHDSRFEIETPSAVAAARGTEYRVAVDGQATTRAEMLESSIELSAMGKAVRLEEGEGSLARLNEPPLPPRRLLLPPAPLDLRQQYEKLPAAIRFAGVDRASGYRIVLARDREGRQVVREETVKPDAAFQIPVLGDGIYYLITSSIDGAGLEGLQMEPAPVTVHMVRKKPAPPVLVTPEEGAKIHGRNVPVIWQTSADAVHYHVQIAGDRAFTRLLTDSNHCAGTSYLAEKTVAGTYYLRVSSTGEDGLEGDWSTVREFSVARLPAPVLELAEVSGKELHFAWNRLDDEVSYQLQIARDDRFEDIVLDRELSQAGFTAEKFREPGRYYVRVRALDSTRYSDSYSKTASFEIEKPKGFPYELLGVIGVMFLFLL